MGSSSPARKVLEELWRSRLNDAKLRLDFARNYVADVQRDHPSGDIPESDYHFADQKALRSENLALEEYNRVLRIYPDLVVNGTIPEEADWQRRQAAGANGGGEPT